MRKVAKKRPTIGVLAGAQVYYGTILGNFIGPLLHGVCAAADDRQCNLLLGCGMDNSYAPGRPGWPLPAGDVDFLPVGPWNTDGLIVVNPLFSKDRSDFIQQLISGGHPVIFAAAGEDGPTVAIDNEAGIRRVLLHLIAHGHKRIAFIAGIPDDLEGDSGIRLRAFQSIVREYGLDSDARLIAYGMHGIDGGQQAMRQILNGGVSFSAVLASNDESAIGAMSVLKEAGFRIPQDIAIIGMDDSLEALTQTPALTTLHSSAFRMGYLALEALLDYIEGRMKKLDHIRVPMQLVIRESCGCQPSSLPRFVFMGSREPVSRKDEHAVTNQLTQSMTETIMAATQGLSPDEVRTRCWHLVESFIESLDRHDPGDFRRAVQDTLEIVEKLEGDSHVWHAAFSTFERGLELIRDMMKWPQADQQPEEMLREARAIINQTLQRQHRRSIIHQKWITDQAGRLNAHLLAALDEAQVYEILASRLPQVGIQHVGVAFFEAQGADPLGWSQLRKVSEHDGFGHEGADLRFPSRQFPPKGLYDEPYRLVLLPMASREEMSGFVVFDAANLEICANIVWQLVTFLKVGRLYRDATEGRRLAEEANRLKSRFLSTVSHELRTPLNLILGLSSILLEEQQDGEARTHWQDIRQIHASAQHLDGLIQDVLDLAQNEMGQLKLVCEPLNLADAFKVIVAVGEQLVHNKGLEWQVSIPDGLPLVWGDRTRLRQVALNLINNAVKFTTRGKVVLRVSGSEAGVVVTISDTGLGIPPDEQGVIFDEFRQSERTTARGYGGLGLGLAICKRLVEMHGGEIGVSSSGEEGAGSTFHFSLPAMKSDVQPEKLKLLAPDQTVLLFAEEAGSGEQMRDYLTRQGFGVKLVLTDENTDWSSQLLKSPPGAVILEQGIATRRGWEFLKLLKDNPSTQDVPVWFYALDGARGSGSVLELNYLTKPMDRLELTRALDRQGLREGASQRPKTILIVDDDPGSLEMHARIVTMWSAGCRILKATNGREALAVIQETHPDLVLLDLMMPELDGFGVLEAMRSDERSRSIPVLVLTAQKLTLEDMAKFNQGVTSVLAKGLFSVEETLAHVETALSHSQTLGSETQRVVRKAMAFLHEHYMESISLEDTARYVGMSREYLARCFHQAMGITLVTYLNRYRVSRGKELLEQGGQSLTEIALETGFSSSTYFSRVFKQEVGMSPSEYEREYRERRG